MERMSMSFTLPDHLPDKEHAYLLIQKNKNGPLGYVEMNWTPECTRLSDPMMLNMGGRRWLYKNLDQVWADFKAKDKADF